MKRAEQARLQAEWKTLEQSGPFRFFSFSLKCAYSSDW